MATLDVDIMSAAPETIYHQPAMVAEVLEYLAPRPGAVIVDGTCGTGGHSLAILPRLLPNGRLIAMDQDAEALGLAQSRLVEFAPAVTPPPISSPEAMLRDATVRVPRTLIGGGVTFHHGNFRALASLLADLHLERIDGVLLDLGLSSLHVDRPERGFSFLKAGPLDMRMDVRQPMTASTLVNTWSEEDLTHVIATFGEERFARRIARRIVEERRRQPIDTTTQLAGLITRAVPPAARRGRLHAATRTFQALRMAVNDELGALEEALNTLPTLLSPNGRAVLLTFHSLEDRLVKRAFLQGQRDGVWTVLTKKPQRPTPEEVTNNPRVRSVKLRAAERV
jgi:16S rRNA (cytosine1402-N4)-methyltransferase